MKATLRQVQEDKVVDKRMTSKEVVAQIRDGDTVAIGGWGPYSKPMVLIREIVKSKLKDLTIISFAGIDVDLLIGAGKVKKLIFAFMSLEGAPAVPANYRRARANASIEVMEISEYMQIAGLKAAAERVPFHATRSGIGTDILTVNPEIKTIDCPYTGEKLVAMPALKADVALVHVNAAEPKGYGRILANPYFDAVMVRGADKAFLSAERIINVSELKTGYNSTEILKSWVTGIVEAPFGAHPGDMWPDYEWDNGHLNEYSKAAADPEAFKKYLDKYVFGAPDHKAYLKLVGKL